MKKLLTALFLGLFVAAGSPMVLHADEAAAGSSETEVKETPKKEQKKKKNKKKRNKKRNKKHKKAAEAPKEESQPAEGAAQ